MRRATSRALALALLLGAAPSCAMILGDDFTIEDKDGKGSTSGDPCASVDQCDACVQGICPAEYSACVPGTDCYAILDCANHCTDQACIDGCKYDQDNNPKPGLNDVFAFAQCACGGDCTDICTQECVC